MLTRAETPLPCGYLCQIGIQELLLLAVNSLLRTMRKAHKTKPAAALLRRRVKFFAKVRCLLVVSNLAEAYRIVAISLRGVDGQRAANVKRTSV